MEQSNIITESVVMPYEFIESSAIICRAGGVEALPIREAIVPHNVADIREPYEFSFISFHGILYYLKTPLSCELTHRNGTYFLSCPLLDISVWGNSFDEAVEAFSFSFHSTYQNFALEHDEMLTEEGRGLKNLLLSLVGFTM